MISDSSRERADGAQEPAVRVGRGEEGGPWPSSHSPPPTPGAKNVNARHCVSPFRPASLSHLASTHQEVVLSQRPPDGAKRGVRPEPATPGGTCRLPVPRGGVAAKCSAALKSEGGDPTRPGRPAPGPRGPHLAAPAPSPASLQVPSGRRPVLLALTGCHDGLFLYSEPSVLSILFFFC